MLANPDALLEEMEEKLKKRWRLQLLCEYCCGVQECGPDGKGYVIEEPGDLLKQARSPGRSGRVAESTQCVSLASHLLACCGRPLTRRTADSAAPARRSCSPSCATPWWW